MKTNRQLSTFMNPAVVSIVHFDLSKAVPDLYQCESSITMDGTEESAIVAQFNEFLVSRFYPWFVTAPRVVSVRNATLRG